MQYRKVECCLFFNTNRIDKSKDTISIKDSKGDTSAYSFENEYSALRHINQLEKGNAHDAGKFGKHDINTME